MAQLEAVPRPLAVITGVGEGVGASLAGMLARAGYDLVGIARSERVKAELSARVAAGGGAYRHLACDLTDAPAVTARLAPLAAGVAVVVHNAHHLLIKPFEETSAEEFERVWRVACFGAMLVAQTLLPAMAARGSGTMIFTGATASRRGGAKFSAFASAKFALRGLAQALAREYGPRGVHVAHVVIDGLIWEPQTRQRFSPSQAGCLAPDAIAAAYLGIIEQPVSAWTHELDLRPFSERF
ncbi:MAG: SDR family NAD(P)-dependent oxidoreductase [Azospirillum sp.]|nr:SDR family NAD(P)-dependent oxidoreductase [Azospirillum sp.]